MPRSDLPTAIVQAVNASSTSEIFLALIEASHPNWASTVRIVNNTEDVTKGADTFDAFPFEIMLPADSEELQPFLRVRVSNSSRELIEEFRGIAGNRTFASATVYIVAASDPDTALTTWSNFELRNLVYDGEFLNFELAIETFLTEPFPSLSFTPSTFPGLF